MPPRPFPPLSLALLLCLSSAPWIADGFFQPVPPTFRRCPRSPTDVAALVAEEAEGGAPSSAAAAGWGRRDVLRSAAAASLGALTSAATLASLPLPAPAAFTPGGTLLDRDVGVQLGNPEASASRRADNSNVLFSQDHYFKFGSAAPWIPPGSADYPKTMPFTLSQQRYDAMKKYGDRVRAAVRAVSGLGGSLSSADTAGDRAAAVGDPSSPAYALRAMGLLANNMLASENTGTTNELLLSRWYINEVYLGLGDAAAAGSKEDAMRSYGSAVRALNSYLGMMNRVIIPKVGDKFELAPQ